MIFSIIIILLVAAVTYFHYTQGLFSATISAICAILAAVLAFSYHETVIYSLLRGKVADYAHGMILIAMFAAIYTILRVLFDSMVPGNLRFPTLLDRVGAAAMGLVAAIFAVGIFAIAAQELPFGPSIGMYTRYKTQSQADVQVPGRRQQEDAYVFDVIGADKPGQFEEADHGGLLVPVDDMLVNLVGKLSEGALAGDRRLSDVHPAFLDELFAQRLGIQVGANHVALNVKDLSQVSVQGAYTVDTLAQADSELPDIRKGAPLKGIDPLLKPLPNQIILILRTMFGRGADDADHNVRFSPASVRLVAGGKNYHPVGVLDSDMILRLNRLDDFVVVGAERGADMVFVVDRNDLGAPPAPSGKRGSESAAAGESKIKNGVFLEVKRMGVIDLSGKSIDQSLQPAENVGPLRKKGAPPAKAAPPPAPSQQAAAAADVPVTDAKASVSNKLFTDLNVGSYDDNTEVTFASGKATLREKRFVKLTVDMTQTLTLLKQGDFVVSDFFVPPGTKMVQVKAVPGEPWNWAESLGEFELVDAGGAKYKPNGAWAKVKGAQGSERMVARYDSTAPVTDVAHEEGRPTDVWIAFLVPENTKIKSLNYKGKPAQALDLDVK